MRGIIYKGNNAVAAAGLICLLLEKDKNPVSIQKGTAYYLDRIMDDKTMEIPEAAINVEEIVQKIRENIRRRQAAGERPADPDSGIGNPSNHCHSGESDDTIRHDLLNINSRWDIHNDRYIISSHQPYIGKFLVKGRELFHGEVRRYVDPIISQQTEFNASTVRIINRTSEQCAELNQHQQNLETAFSSFKPESDKKIADCIAAVKNELDSRIELKIKELLIQMDEDIHARMQLAHMLEDRVRKDLAEKRASPVSPQKDSPNYFLFEERFRGSREEIRQRQMAFLPYFEKCSRVLDIGCGRGEFLEILKDHAIGGLGVDNDPDMVAYCRSRHFEVEQTDANDYLETLEDNSLDGIFIDQVVEHLEPDYLFRLLALCHQKIKSGYHIVIETVNPLSFVSFVNFYIDMTHTKPVHPEALKFLMGAAGFKEITTNVSSPISPELRLKKFPGTEDDKEYSEVSRAIYNENIEKLNDILYGDQDYSVIGKKM